MSKYNRWSFLIGRCSIGMATHSTLC